MTREQFKAWVQEIDPANAEYILADGDILSQYQNYLSWKNKHSTNVRIAKDFGKNVDETCNRMAENILHSLEKSIRQYGEYHLTPANAKVGDGATVYLYSDSHAGTIVKVTKCTVTVRRDKATLDPNFKPEFIPGGFCAHCTNQDEQKYTYEPNENGELTTVRWSKKYNRYGQPGDIRLGKGRHEFYDYNF